MTNIDINTNIESLQNKLQLLISKYKQLQEDNAKLQETIEALEADQKEKRIHIFQLEQKLTAAQSAIHQTEREEEEKRMMQKKIDSYIKEIDKCLALLHAQ